MVKQGALDAPPSTQLVVYHNHILVQRMLGMPVTYAGTLDQACRHAWKTERQMVQRDRDLGVLLPGSGAGKRSREEADLEEPPSKRLTEPADVLRMPVS